MNIPNERQRLIFRGKLLINDDEIEKHKIEDGSVLHLVANPPQVQEDPPIPIQQTHQNLISQTIADTAELAIITSLLRTIS